MVYLEHVPVLAEEVVKYIVNNDSGIYVDATAGSGGHATEILKNLSSNGRVILLDVDPQAIEYLKEKFSSDTRVYIFNRSYTDIPKVLDDMGLSEVHGAIFDLGVSTHQLYDGKRGFSFMREGPLDMRFSMNSDAISAYDVVNTYDEEVLASIFQTYGEEPYAEEVANAIVRYRQIKPIETTVELAGIVSSVVSSKYNLKKHPATRVFQALRVYVNSEFSNIEKGIEGVVNVLASGGRLGVITYHSLEDKLVKKIFSRLKHRGIVRLIKKDGVRPRWDEKKRNRKARSAILRIVEKR